MATATPSFADPVGNTAEPVRLALTTALLRVPPTYFVTEHSRLLIQQDKVRAVAVPLAGQVEDPRIGVPLTAALPPQAGSWDMRRRLAGLALPRQYALLRRLRPDVIHQHHSVWSLAAVAASRHLRVPMVTTVHGTDVTRSAGSATDPMTRWHRRNTTAALRHSARTLAVSGYLAGIAQRAGACPDRLDVLYQGIDTEAFTLPAHQPDGELRLLFVGRLVEQKQPRLVFDCAQALRRDGAKVRVEIVGDGPLRADLEAYARSLEVPCTWHGAVPREQVCSVLQSADALILPSRGEAAGLVLLEAQACGVPVVVTDGDGKKEMLADGTTGAVVPADADGACLARAVRPFLEGHRADGALAEACRRFVVQERSSQVAALRLHEIYASVLNR